MLSYTYKIIHTPSQQYYFGFRGANNYPASEDLWVRYFTSSKNIKYLIEQDGLTAFQTFILLENEDPLVCYWYEQVLIREHKEDPLCLNGFYIDPNTEIKNHRAVVSIGKDKIPMSEATKLKMSLAKRGKKLSEDHKRKISASMGKCYEITTPTKEVLTITNLTSFCNQNNISLTSMRNVSKCRQKQHRGYIVKIIE